MEAFRESDIAKILEHIPQHEFGLALTLLLYTGMRRGELLALQWSSVDLKEDIITIKQVVVEAEKGFDIDTTKNKKSRKRPIKEQLHYALEYTKRTSLYVIPEKNGTALPPRDFHSAYVKSFEDLNAELGLCISLLIQLYGNLQNG